MAAPNIELVRTHSAFEFEWRVIFTNTITQCCCYLNVSPLYMFPFYPSYDTYLGNDMTSIHMKTSRHSDDIASYANQFHALFP